MDKEKEGLPLLHEEPEDSTLERWKSRAAILSILLILFCERLAYYAITVNLVAFCNDYIEEDSGLTVALLFQGTAFFLPLVPGIIADTLLGKKKLLTICLPVYILGGIFLTIAGDIHQEQNTRVGLYYTGLSLCAVGAACVNSVITPYGADQIDTKSAQRSFFHWSYFVINVGALTAITGINYIENVDGYWLGFMFAPLSLTIALIAFHLTKKWCTERDNPSYWLLVAARQVLERFKSGKCNSGSHATLSTRRNFAVEAEDKKMFTRVVINIATLLGFSVIMSSFQSTYQIQGQRLNATFIGTGKITASSIGSFDVLIIIIIIPILDILVWPFLMSKGIKISHLYRIGFGTLCGILSAFAAILVEVTRSSSQLSILVQTPQYILMGLGEVFVYIPGYEIAYIESPSFTKSTSISLVFINMGIGYYLSTMIINFGKEDWLAPHKNPQLVYLFAILMSVGIAFFILYLIVTCTRKYYHVFHQGTNLSGCVNPDDSVSSNH